MNRYRTKSKEVTAIQLKKCMTLPGSRGDVGDWLVDDGKDQFFLTNQEFIAAYESIINIVPTPMPYAPFPDIYKDTYPWPTNPQWPTGPTYWTSSSIAKTGEGNFRCINIPKCVDGQFHTFPDIDTVGDKVVTCLKCGKTVSDALGINAVKESNK